MDRMDMPVSPEMGWLGHTESWRPLTDVESAEVSRVQWTSQFRTDRLNGLPQEFLPLSEQERRAADREFRDLMGSVFSYCEERTGLGMLLGIVQR